MPSIFDQMKSKKGTSVFSQMNKGALPKITPQNIKAPEQMESEMTENKPLPSGALGWKPDGTPDYGQGVQGWWNGIQSRITAPEIVDGAETAPDAIDVAKRVGGEVFNQVVGALNVPQQSYYKYLADRRSYEMYADMVNENTPDIYSDNELGNFLRLTTSLVPGISNLTTMFEKDRIQNGTRRLPDGTFEKIQEANRIWNKDNVGTAIFDTQVQAEYIRRVLAGEDPYKLTKEYSKPLQNFIADIALDPLNVFDGLGIASKFAGKALKGLETLPELTKAAEGLRLAAANGTDATNLITDVSKFMSAKTTKNLDNAKNISMALGEFTQDSKRVQLADKLEGVTFPLIKFARGNVQTLDNLLKAFAKFGSTNADEAAQGARILQDNKILHLFLNDNAAEVAKFMNKMDTAVKGADEITDTTKYIEAYKTAATNVFEELYPDTTKVADALDEIEKLRKVDPNAKLPDNLSKYDGYTMSPAGKFIARQHKALQEGFLGTKIGVKPINEFFSLIYLTSPGFAVRNYLNAAATTFIDFGPKGLRDMVDFAGSSKYIEDMFGLKPDSIARAFSAVTTSKKGAKGIMKPFEYMRGIASKGEEYESLAVAATAGKKYSKEMLQAGRFIESMDNLKAAGFSDDALKFLEKKIRQYNGQTDKALTEFTQQFNAGTIEHFREPEVIFGDNLLKVMDGYNANFTDEIRDVLKEGTLEEVLQKVDNMLADIEKKTYSTIDDIQPDYVDDSSQMLISLREGLGLSDEGLDPFAKKRNVGRRLEDAIIGSASEILPKGARQAFTMEARKYTADIMNFQSKFSTTVKSLVLRVGNGTLGVKELIKQISTDPMFAKMGDLKIAADSSRKTAVDVIWTYYKKHMLDLWVGNSKKQYELLLQKIGDVPLQGRKAAVLENLKMKFATDFRYLNADLKDGKAFINEAFHQSELGNKVESVQEIGKKLGLFTSEIQKGVEGGRRIPHRETTLAAINDFMKKAGLGKIGDLNVEANYNQAVKALLDYSNVKERLTTARGLLKGMVVPADLAKRARQAANGSVDEMQKVIDEISTFYDSKQVAGATDVQKAAVDIGMNKQVASESDKVFAKIIDDKAVEIKQAYKNIDDKYAERLKKLEDDKNSVSNYIIGKDRDKLDKLPLEEQKLIRKTYFNNYSKELDLIDVIRKEKDKVGKVISDKGIAEAKKAGWVLTENYKWIKKTSEAVTGSKKAATATADVAQSAKKAPIKIPKLPKELQGAKNKYNYGSKAFEITFDNDIDRAFYYVGGKGESKSHRAYYEFLKNIFGDDTDKLVAEYGTSIRNKIKGIAKSSEPGNIEIDRVFTEYGKYIKQVDEVIPNEVINAKKLIGESKVNKLEDFESAINRIPDVGDGNIPDPAKVNAANYAGTKKMFNAIKEGISNTYGKSENVSNLTMAQAKELSKWASANEVKMLDFRTRLLAQMKGAKDFALLDYAGGKKNLDLAMAYIFPYQFWYSRTYANWIKRLVANPAIVNRYQKYREFQEQQNKDLPEYMRNYVVLGKSIGMAENPLLLNLEASLNPLNGITGVDFTDKNKIVGTPGTLEYAWTKTLDSVGKYGPSPWTPINILTAAGLSAKGEKDAAARWAGRFFPQSGPIKAVASLFGKNVELDPMVLLFDDGSKTDPYESRRVGRALIALKEAGKITMEQAYEAARTKSGPVWEEATVFATKNRAMGTLSAYALGQGFKVRSGYEAEIDKFYEEYFKMWANKDKFSPDEMSNYQRYIRTKYEWADLVILANKGSKERDKAYAYSVLGRIAPGQNSEIAKSLGMDSGLMDKFYADKGEMDGWNPLDRELFMNSMVQLGTLLSIPKPETLNEWQNVKTIYRQVDKDLVTRFGADITQKIEAFYEFAYDSMEQKNYMEAHPDVQEALDYKDALIAGNPVIAPYYDGLTRLERYYDGEFRRKVTETIDPNYYDYYKIRGLIIDPAELKAFDKQVNWTAMSKQYFSLKKEWDIMTAKKLDEYDKYLGSPNLTGVQQNVDLSVAQSQLMDVLQPPQEKQLPSWDQIRSDIMIPLTLEKALQQYFSSDRTFNSIENTMTGKLLNNINQIYGLDLSKEDMLGLAMNYYR